MLSPSNKPIEHDIHRDVIGNSVTTQGVIKIYRAYLCAEAAGFTELTADPLAQLVEHRTAVREVVGSNLYRTYAQGL